jgi:hypothetical protein
MGELQPVKEPIASLSSGLQEMKMWEMWVHMRGKHGRQETIFGLRSKNSSVNWKERRSVT